MKKMFLSLLRDKNTGIEAFRHAADQMASLLSFEASEALEKEEYSVETPLATSKGYRHKQEVVLIPILRAGLSLLPAFLKMFPASRVGFVGIRRDEDTALPRLYYKNLPEIPENAAVIVLDPMIATGGSGNLTLELLKSLHIPDERIMYVGVVAAPDGLAMLRKKCPHLKIICAQVDERLNDKKYIVPGLGDFGDRYFGT